MSHRTPVFAIALAIMVALTIALTSCGRCRTSSDCSTGERCDFDTGDCVLGCTGDGDCASTARCNVERGRCEPRMRPPLITDDDAGDEDVGTSTRSDAAAGD